MTNDMKKTQEQLQQIIDWMSATSIGLLELHTPHDTVRLARRGAQVETLPLEDNDPLPSSPPTTVNAPSLGVFLHTHPLSNKPLAAIGERAGAGQPLGLLQIGPLLLPVSAADNGLLLAMRTPHGATVGYGTALAELQND